MPSCCVMCCGCQRLMDNEGKASIPFAPRGIIDVNFGPDPETFVPNPYISARVFSNHEDADTEARKVGWSALDGNHRCPECALRELEARSEQRESRVGAYIDLPGHTETPIRRKTENAIGK